MIFLKEDFKRFVKSNPNLVNYVKQKKGTWQDLFEVYSLYGEDSNVWDKYLNDNSIDELIKMVKNINLDSIKNVIDGLQKAISIIQNLSSNDIKYDSYEPKESYSNLDD